MSAPDGQTRDVWVLSDDEQPPHVSLWRPAVESARVERSQRVIQSRVADDLFWLGRYNERADWVMRVLRGALRRVEEDSGPGDGPPRRPQVPRGAADKQDHRAARRSPRAIAARRREIETIAARAAHRRRPKASARWSGPSRASTASPIWRATGCRSKLADAEPVPARRHLGRRSLTAASPVAVLDLLDEGLASLAAFNGLMHENMTRNFGWSFLDMGRRLERAYNLSEAILSLFVPRAGRRGGERAACCCCSSWPTASSPTARATASIPMLPLVLDLLLLDETNPRSLAFQLVAISRHFETLPDGRAASACPRTAG